MGCGAIRAPSRCQDKLGRKRAYNPIVWSLLVAGRTQERSAPTQLHTPCLSDGLLRIVLVESPTRGVLVDVAENSGEVFITDPTADHDWNVDNLQIQSCPTCPS